jgi:hypothetical protein
VRISEAGLRVLAGWADWFAARPPIGRWQGGDANAEGVIAMPWYEYSDEMERFVSDMSRAGIVRPVDWMAWAGTPEARRLIDDPAQIADATHDDIIYLLTTIIRGERFSDGEIAAAYERGTLLAIARRAGTLRDGAEG